MKGKGIWLLACCLLFSSMAPAAWAVVDPPANGYVADYADVLEKETEDYIIELNQVLQQATGAQIVVVTVDFTDGMSLEEYAYNIFNEWGIGDKEKNNGLLLLLSIGNDDYWAMQGKGLENALTSAMLGEYLYQELEPDFAQGQYNAGVKKVFDSFYAWFVNYYGVMGQDSADIQAATPVAGTEEQQSVSIVGWFFIFVLIISMFIGFRQSYVQRRARAHRRSMMAPPVYPPYRPLSPGGRVRWPSQSVSPAPKEKPKNDSNHSGGGFFGGGASRGGGAGRQSAGGNQAKKTAGKKAKTGASKMKSGSFGGGVSRGGGTGRQSSGGFRPQSRGPVAGARKAGSFGGGKTRGGGAGRRP